jgi:hypothetical protein
MVSLHNGTLLIDTFNLTGFSAGGNGGIVYTEGQVNVTIKSTIFNSITAGTGGIIYSSGTNTDP